MLVAQHFFKQCRKSLTFNDRKPNIDASHIDNSDCGTLQCTLRHCAILLSTVSGNCIKCRLKSLPVSLPTGHWQLPSLDNWTLATDASCAICGHCRVIVAGLAGLLKIAHTQSWLISPRMALALTALVAATVTLSHCPST